MVDFINRGVLTPEGEKVKAFIEAQLNAEPDSSKRSGTINRYAVLVGGGLHTAESFIEAYANPLQIVYEQSKDSQPEQPEAEEAPAQESASGVMQALEALKHEIEALAQRLTTLELTNVGEQLANEAVTPPRRPGRPAKASKKTVEPLDDEDDEQEDSE